LIRNSIERLEKYQIEYFVESDTKRSNNLLNGIPVITLKDLQIKDPMKQMNIVIADGGNDRIYHQILELGYSKENMVAVSDVIKEASDNEYKLFTQKYKNIEENVQIKVTAAKIIEDLKKSGFEVVYYSIDKDDYNTYLKNADYETNYPAYLNEFKEHLSSKTVQHYVSYKLLNMQSGSVYVDIASSNSVFPDIVEKLCHVKAYKQDIWYQWGIHGNKIGSYASSVPMPDHSVDYMALHCSFEHFEGNEDFKFFGEAYRLLPAGGKVCIIPLYLSDEYVIQTSPSVWLNKYAVYGKAPELDARAKISINDSICQRQSKFLSVDILTEELIRKYNDKFKIQIYYIENCGEVKGANPFALVLEKL